MSTEQPESAHPQGETPAADTQVDITQPVTTPTPTTKPAKNPEQVAAGKLVAERTRQAREAQKNAAAQTAVIIANNNAKTTTEAPAPASAPAPATEN